MFALFSETRLMRKRSLDDGGNKNNSMSNKLQQLVIIVIITYTYIYRVCVHVYIHIYIYIYI